MKDSDFAIVEVKERMTVKSQMINKYGKPYLWQVPPDSKAPVLLAFVCVKGMLHMKKVIITENEILVLGMKRAKSKQSH